MSNNQSVAEDNACPICASPIIFGPGRSVTTRHTRPADAQAISDLYSRLGDDDRRRRFFTGSWPPPEFFESWASIAAAGGFGLLAVNDSERGEIAVAEAGYSALADGDAELGMAVDPDHRGLGRLLLERLLLHARQRGIQNLQAVVLTDNESMMGLVRRHGYAVLGHPDWGIVRVTMSTSEGMPSWPPIQEGPRVLIESRRGRSAGENLLRSAGFEVAVCSGPGHGLAHCPVLGGEPCPLIAGADAVIVDLAMDEPDARQLLASELVVHPGLRCVLGFSTDHDGATKRVPPEDLVSAIVEATADSSTEPENHPEP